MKSILGKIPLLSLLLAASLAHGQLQLSPDAYISVITCGPDPNELYAAFGHSAIRVYDPANGLDDAFNYGVFDFDQPNFYLNFARGYLYYKLGVYYYSDFEAYYKRHQRFVHEQRLNLTPAQKQKLFDYLAWNARPENQTYRYDYYHNNCATKIRDVLNEQLGADILWDSSHVQPTHSFRQKTDAYLSPLPWGDLGIDICLGSPIDRPMTAWEHMFLPDYVESFVDLATVVHDSVRTALVAEKKIIYEPAPVATWTAFVHPWVVVGGLLLIVLWVSWRDWQRKRISRGLDVILFGLAGLIGLLLLALWLFTDHRDAARNMNLLWAFPLHGVGAVMLLFKRSWPWAKAYFGFASFLSAVALAGWWGWPQELNPLLVPVVICLWVRAGLLWRMQGNPDAASAATV
ncbi:MAG: DUF4105 domain-containing protein [Cyclobacteriaceae bacterium]|nr:DUF4105 domain-containing protein [Cyclobacteriaceae bacterium]